ncbi:MAG: WhiB family transcriptional regulator [Streptosporangiales bacterium]
MSALSSEHRSRELRTSVAAQAACRGMETDVFFPETWEEPAPALGVCAKCSARTECLELALATNERFGVWGGTTEQERRRMRRARTAVTDTEVA